MIKARVVMVLLCVLFSSILSLAQELRCDVQVLRERITNTNSQTFESLEASIKNFMNTQRFTSKVYSPFERIECNLVLNILEVNGDLFRGQLQIQSSRPVYDSDYKSVVLNHYDENVSFNFSDFQTIVYNKDFTSQGGLVGLLAFYANLIVGMDNDTYKAEGGNTELREANKVASKLQSSSYTGWNPYENNRNRALLIEQILNPDFSTIREYNYQYHRKGLDVMASDPAKGRKAILESLVLLDEFNKRRPLTFFMRSVIDAKSNEYVQVFSEGTDDEKQQAYSILRRIYPAKSSFFKQIIDR